MATKFGREMGDGLEGASADYIPKAADASLKRLGVDHIDLYQLHKPFPETPIAETLGALDELVKAGKVREIGCSNCSLAQMREAEEAVGEGAARFICVQNHYSLLKRDDEAEVLPECARKGIGFLPWFPLESGLLTGKYRLGQDHPDGSRWKDGFGGDWAFKDGEKKLQRIEALIEYSESRGHTMLELAFSWLVARDEVSSVIAGAMNPEQFRTNAAAVSWELTEKELAEVDRILAGETDRERMSWPPRKCELSFGTTSHDDNISTAPPQHEGMT